MNSLSLSFCGTANPRASCQSSYSSHAVSGHSSELALRTGGIGPPLVPIANARLLRAALPDSRLVVFAGTGHASLAQEPESLAGEINRFLERQR